MTGGTVIFSTHRLHDEVTAALEALGDYRVARAPTPEAIVRDSAGAEIIVVRANIPPEIVRREVGLRALVRHGAGLDMVPMDVATEAGVLVANVPGANSVTVAEHVIWTAAALLRHYPEVNTDLRRDGWEAGRRHGMTAREISGKTIGIIGMGNIGKELARIARHGFGMKLLTHTRSPQNVPDGIEVCTLAGLLAQAEVVAICCPLTAATRGMIDAAALARMRPDAVLINVSRGPIVDEGAVAHALGSGVIQGAALDVFADQPLDPDSPLFDLRNVILTPHLSGITEESMRRMGQGVVAEVRRLLSGALPLNLVNPDALARHRERFPQA